MDNRVIATARVVEPVAGRLQEAAPTATKDKSQKLEGLTDLERAQLVAGLMNARGELLNSERVYGVMNSPQNKYASLLQTMVVENATDQSALPNKDTLEAKFDTGDWFGWLGTFWEMVKHAKKFTWNPAPAGAEHVAQFDKASPRMAVFGDWATGLYGAPLIRDSVQNDPGTVDIIMHLGDTYYSGKTGEVKSRFVEMWPKRPGSLSRALNGNHEMYTGGQPYIDAIAKAPFEQPRSHFAWQNDHWIVVGMDTAYEEHDLTASQVDWLNAIVADAQGRRVVLFSHHQPFSRLNKPGPKLVEKMKPVLEGKKIFAWYWGHEHACVLYDKHPQWNLYGRCIGHGGMPEFRPKDMGPAVKDRQFRRFDAKDLAPESTILDGPNPYIKGEETKFSPHGYAMLQFESDRLVETIHDADGTALVTNELR